MNTNTIYTIDTIHNDADTDTMDTDTIDTDTIDTDTMILLL